jgi:pimeloyl-ACP methyl ester carboxylesterase
VLYGGIDAGASGHIERMKPPSTRGYLYQLMAMVGWTSAPFLPFVSAPTLVMMGDKDNIVPLINGKFLKNLLPHARLEIIKGGGHLFLVAHAAECAAMIRGFLDEPGEALRAAA